MIKSIKDIQANNNTIENVESVLFTLKSEVSDQIDIVKYYDFKTPATMDFNNWSASNDQGQSSILDMEPNEKWSHMTIHQVNYTDEYVITNAELSKMYNERQQA